MSISDFNWPAPAKLNLFLHITGRRDDGYHDLQTVFQFLSIGDRLTFHISNDGRIYRDSGNATIPEQDDLVVKAAKALQHQSGTSLGVGISLHKTLPVGGGLGGGSSDAATTLVALNELWQTGISVAELAAIGLKLGADIPVFVRGEAAWAEGVGEQLTPVELPQPWYVVVYPEISIATAQLFGAPELTRDVRPITIRDYLEAGGSNVFESVAKTRFPVIAEALEWLSQASGTKASMTGTGSCIFAAVASRTKAEELAQNVPHGWQAFSAQGLNQSPLVEAKKTYNRI